MKHKITCLILFISFLTVINAHAGTITDESSGTESGGSYNSPQTGDQKTYPPSNTSDSTTKPRSTKQAAKEAANDAVGSIIRSIGEGISKSIQRHNASEQPIEPQNPQGEGRRPKERRY